MPKYYMMPNKCCCCRLRTASIVVGILSVIVALTFMGLSAGFSSGVKTSCEDSCTDSGCSFKCTPPSGTEKMVSNILAILAIMNAVEVIMSVGLIWGASKIILFWVTGWLLVTSSWILLHCTVAISLLFATSQALVIILVSVLGIFILGMSILAFLTVLSLRNEMTNGAAQSQS